ncbi:MAG: glutamate-cysteine ligase family protein [Balneolaceae bacterium]
MIFYTGLNRRKEGNTIMRIQQKRPLHLFEGYGVEMEYMIVDRDTLNIKPVCDKILQQLAGSIVNEWPTGMLALSNELVLHVIEIKTNGPAESLFRMAENFQDEVRHVNNLLEALHAILMPGPMHPWMNPFTEMKLWPHEYNPIYEAYNRIFDCRGHGWANLQSTHLNLPFCGDDEFEKLHAACRIILPLIPALSAASPIADEISTPFLNYRMEVYRTNSKNIPSVTGKVISEAVFSEAAYREQIFNRMYDDIAPYDPEGILRDEWLNSRGVMARFDRGAIEIRIVDNQECPAADMAILEWITASIQALVEEKWCSLSEQKKWHENDLYEIFLDTIKNGERTRITNREYLNLFQVDKKSIEAGFLCQEIYERVKGSFLFSPSTAGSLGTIFNKGTLARRILHSLPAAFTKKDLFQTYRKICVCLNEGEFYVP